MSDSEKNLRRFARVSAKSIIVSIHDLNGEESFTGFLRDVSEGGLRIQKISEKRQAELGRYFCQFFLPTLGKVSSPVEVVGFGDADDKFSAHLVRMRFVDIPAESKEKVKQFVEKQLNENTL